MKILLAGYNLDYDLIRELKDKSASKTRLDTGNYFGGLRSYQPQPKAR